MPAFAYHAVDRAGRRVRGIEDATNSIALTRSLEGRGLVIVTLAPSERGASAPLGRLGHGRAVLEVTRALAALLPAGLPLARALNATLALGDPRLRDALAAVRSKVERGGGLAAAMAEHPSLFSPLYVGLVRAGERSGDLIGAFRRLADQLEREERLRSRLLSLSIYPLILAIAGSAAVLVLLVFVLPRFGELLTGAGAKLPASTAMLLGVSTGIRANWLVLAVVAVVITGLVAWIVGAPDGRRALASTALRVPLIAPLRQATIAARFGRLLGVLLAGGAPLLSALDDTAESIGDPMAAAEVTRIRARVREGVALHRALGEGELWPELFSQLVSVGEESSRLQEFLLKAADLFEERTERAMQRLMTLAEPAMILVFGGVVAFVALSLLQAIYGVNASAFR